MKKKILLWTLIPLQFVFFLWITGCGHKNSVPVSPASSSTVHALEIVDGCDLNSCLGPPFFTQASEIAFFNGTGPEVQCSVSDSVLLTVCPTSAVNQEATETATAPPNTPTITPTPLTPTATPTFTFTPTDTFTPSPTATPTPGACQQCLNNYANTLIQIGVDFLTPDDTLLECNDICAGAPNPALFEECYGTCEAASDLLSEIQQTADIVDAGITLKNCEDENGCTNDITD